MNNWDHKKLQISLGFFEKVLMTYSEKNETKKQKEVKDD